MTRLICTAFSCIFLFTLLFCAGLSKGDWCVAKFTLTNEQMQKYIESTCGGPDCSAIKPGGSCYEPNTLVNHCSYVLDLNYRKNKVCPLDIGTIAVSDPSFGKCHYP